MVLKLSPTCFARRKARKISKPRHFEISFPSKKIIIVYKNVNKQLILYFALQAVALLFVACVASTQAFYYSPYFNHYSAPTVVRGVNQCFPQRCQACRESFSDEPISTYDCEGKCGLCDLCLNTPNAVPDCQRWCTVGQAACVDNCNKGKALCIGCAGVCGTF